MSLSPQIHPAYQPRPWQRLVQHLAALRPCSWALSYLLPHMDHWMLRWSRGERNLTTLLTGLPVITLRTTGARSGLPRSTYVVAIPHGGNIVLVASALGKPHHPDWYRNLIAHPQVQVAFQDGRTDFYLARQTSGLEREACWREAISYYAGFEAYRRRAKQREIPVMVLEKDVAQLDHSK